MKDLLIPCLLIGAVLLVLPGLAPSQRAINPAQGQEVAREATMGPPSEIRIKYLEQPPEMPPELMEKIRERGTPLAEYAGVKPFRGIVTGLNNAFVIDTPAKEPAS